MTVTTRLEVIGHMASHFYRSIGLNILRQTKDKYSIVSTFIDGTIITVVKLDDTDKEFLCCIAETERSGTIIVEYDSFFGSVQLPIEESRLDRIYENYDGDPEKTFLGYMYKKLSDTSELQVAIDSENECQYHGKWKDFYAKILIPAFKKYQKTNKVELSEEDTKTFIKAANPMIVGHQMFPDRPPAQSTGSSTSSIKSSSTSKIPEDLPKFDDEYELQRRKFHEEHIKRSSPSPFAPIGDRDLYPFGQYPPMRPHLGPDAGNPQSGMIPDRNHPLFRQGPGAGGVGNRGDHPPGSRYDDPLGRDDFDAVGKGLPGGMGLGGSGSGPFGGSNPFGRSGGFGGGFI